MGYPHDGYGQPPYAQQENVSYYPPRNPQSYGQPPYGYGPNRMEAGYSNTSDKLSEDMSFKKLMRDLKEQKKGQKQETKQDS